MGTLWLVGMMGSGKTTVGRLVARRAGVPFLDTDDLVSEASGASIPELWATRGEEGFREAEARVVLGLCREGVGRRVVGTGGGVVLRPDLVAAMWESGLVVWLDADPETLAGRVEDGAGRPLLGAGRRGLAAIDRERREWYREAAHHRVSTEGRSPEEVAEEVARLWTGS